MRRADAARTGLGVGHLLTWACAVLLASASVALPAQTMLPGPAQNVVQLAASATAEVQQDLLTLSMATSREGPDASAVQSQLKAALDAALVEARKLAMPVQMDVRTGGFGLFPRYGRDGKISGWQGNAELLLEGRDFARISAAAGKIQTLTVASVAFGLSREQRSRAEADVQSQAIERFKTKAADIAKAFGFAGFGLREVSVTTNDQGFVPRPRAMALEARAVSADAAVPLEAGKSNVVVSVTGSIQLK